MCRSSNDIHGFYQTDRDRLKIKAFYLRLKITKPHTNTNTNTITLLYLPRISENPLEINDSKVRSDVAAFVTLHRVRSAEKKNNNEVVFASRDVVKASEGVRFEVYAKEEKVLKGIFRKDEVDEEWYLECKCEMEGDLGISEAEVCVVRDGHVAINQKVEMFVKRCRGFQGLLEEIPEERETDVCDCCSCDHEVESDGGECISYASEEEGMESVRWAVDVGIWVMCLGVGYLVSKASSKSLRRRRIF